MRGMGRPGAVATRAAMMLRLAAAAAFAGCLCEGTGPGGPADGSAPTGLTLAFRHVPGYVPPPPRQAVVPFSSAVGGEAAVDIAYRGGTTGWLSVEVDSLVSGGGETAAHVTASVLVDGTALGAHGADVSVTAEGVTRSFGVVLRVEPLFLDLDLPPLAIPASDTVDAITQASSMESTIRLRVDRPVDTTDAVVDVVVIHGDEDEPDNRREWLDGSYPADRFGAIMPIKHWYVRVGETGVCTTAAYVTTRSGKRVEDTLVVTVVSL